MSDSESRQPSTHEIDRITEEAKTVVQLVTDTFSGKIVPADTQNPQRGSDHTFPSYDSQQLSDIGACPIVCEVTAQVPFEHPTWGRSLMLATKPGEALLGQASSNLVAIDSTETLRWYHELGFMEVLKFHNPPIDRLGHIFITYNPGRYDGVGVLRPIIGGFDGISTLPTLDEPGGGRFYSAQPIDVNSDGQLEIEQSSNDCNPTCAGGTTTTVLYHWDGRDYQLTP